MESQRSIERKYKTLLHDVATKDFYKTDLTNRVNCYRCKECGHITKTRDVDAGVTPFMHNCESCSEMAYSTMYSDIAPDQEPTQEWYRPSLEETLKYRKKDYGESMLDHIFNGGLEVRKITPKAETETVYKLTIDVTTCVFFLLSDAFDTIKAYEFDNYEKGSDPIKFELMVCEMTEEEIEGLGEFEGF